MKACEAIVEVPQFCGTGRITANKLIALKKTPAACGEEANHLQYGRKKRYEATGSPWARCTKI